MKFVLLLRNPINRALSSYYHQHQESCEQILLENRIIETIEKAPSVMNKWFNLLLLEPSLFLKIYQEEYANDILLPDLLGGLYFYYLKPWLEIFPIEQFLILKSEDLFDNPAATMKQIYRFLELPDYELAKYCAVNVGSYPAISDRLRHHLARFFHPYNQQLEDYLGMKFNWS